MEETIISFQVAKLAKEKGFDENCYQSYNVYDGELSRFPLLENMGGEPITNPLEYKWKNSLIHKSVITAPTQSLLQKWLREVHNINVYCVPTEIDETKWYNNIASSYKVYTGTYEEALEEGLYQALLLI